MVLGELTQRTEEQSFPRATTQSLQRALPAVINTGSIENTELQLQSHALKREEVGDRRCYAPVSPAHGRRKQDHRVSRTSLRPVAALGLQEVGSEGDCFASYTC